MKRTLRFMPLALSLAAAPAASARTPSGNATGFVASIDEQRGVPTFFWAARARQALPPSLANVGPERRARAYLEQNARTYGLSRAALRTAHVKHVHDTGRGGVIVTFGQRVAKVDVFETEIKILLDRAGDLVAIGGNLHASATGGNKDGRQTFEIDAPEAIAGAFDDLYGVTITPQDLRDLRREANGYRHFDLKSTPKIVRSRIVFSRPARAKKVFDPMPDRLRPAYYLELDVRQSGSKTSGVFGYVIAADTGELLVRRNLTQDLAFNYSIWAQPAAPSIPLEGPHVNYTPHPTGLPDGSVPAFVAPIMTVGPNVMLSNPAIATPSFTAPQVAADTMLTFQVDVGDGVASANDTVNVLVLDVPVGSTGSGTGGAGGMGTGGAGGMGTGGAGGAGTGGEGGSGGAGGSDEVDVGGGCNCEAAGSSGAPGGGWFAPMLAAVAVLLRRRKAAART